MKKNKTNILLILILAAFLRFYKLESNPQNLNLDEVAIGYNAYSILKTGRDEYGVRFPLAFRSHDDYKPPLYIYLTVPVVALFGLNEFAVRFPSALVSILSVLMTYFLTKEIFVKKNSQFDSSTNAARYRNWKFLPIIASFLLAVSPWHLQISRAAFEVNLAVFLNLLGLWAFFKGLKQNTSFWILASICFALSIYTYQVSRLFTPLLLIFLALLYFKNISNKPKPFVVSTLVFVICILPLVPVLISTAGVMRFKGTSVFEHPGLMEEEIERQAFDLEKGNWISTKVSHNRRVAAFLTVAEGYLKHFRPDNLFLGRNGPPYNYTPNVGLFYFAELPFLIWGFVEIWKQKGKEKIFLLGWLLLTPLASAFTWDVPSSTRTAVVLPLTAILSALGLSAFVEEFKKRNSIIFLTSAISVCVIFLFQMAYYLHQYYIHAPVEYAETWQYGYKETVEYVNSVKENYDRIIVSTRLKQVHNFFAFYTKYDPYTYIFTDGGTVSGGFLEVNNRFGKFEFHPINYQKIKSDDKLLLVELYENLPNEFKDKVIKIISLPDNTPYIAIFGT